MWFQQRVLSSIRFDKGIKVTLLTVLKLQVTLAEMLLRDAGVPECFKKKKSWTSKYYITSVGSKEEGCGCPRDIFYKFDI